MTPLQKYRIKYQPILPKSLGKNVVFKGSGSTTSLGDEKEIKAKFPKTFGRPLLHAEKGEKSVSKALKVGVVFSGGQASGGHNVITGLFDTLKMLHHESQLIGFLGGSLGIIEGKTLELSEDLLQSYRNQGGFDLIGSGRTKIETEEQLEKSIEVFNQLFLDGVVIIGGDDSNTNAAILAEFALSKGCKTKVIGVPKTIDGDLKNDFVGISFGFHTACHTYAEMIGNIARDASSAKKYTHFIKLMGRSASHIALECALLTQPNMTLIGEEIAEKKMTLKEITTSLADLIEKRGNQGNNYGVILIPEGIIEFIFEMKVLISELSTLLSEGKDKNALSAEAKATFEFLPKEIAEQFLLDRDPHGNVQVSHIQTEILLSTLVKEELKERPSFKGKFSPLHHFFGYEGRAGLPTNFDATYCYTLGHIAALLIQDGHTGYMCAASQLAKPSSEWEVYAIPITSLMNMEVRKGKEKPVIRKALVDLDGVAYKFFERNRRKWMEEDHYLFPGPIQFEGDASFTDAPPKSLRY
ncbi:MAG: diphosphate--fructose-6-phosphate 1-phosphotransferase [Candidatus Neptunochlamydia sp.]|nr:diphosphate--fructose-6-phosphate 1-phosphotransferase [Candidatus Neptunochlamydia sp.]